MVLGGLNTNKVVWQYFDSSSGRVIDKMFFKKGQLITDQNQLYEVLLFFVIIIFLTIDCREHNKRILREYYEPGLLKTEVFYEINMSNKKEIYFYENGAIKSILTYKKNILEGEQIWFFDNGRIDQKMLYENNERAGDAYFLYRDGILKHFRIFRSGNEVFFGADYWDDSLNLIKSFLHFNDSGQIFSKKNFDNHGNLINEEK